MLATASWPNFFSPMPSSNPQRDYRPAHPSPLSPRAVNTCYPEHGLWGRSHASMSAKGRSSHSASASSSSENETPATPYGKRDIKSNPVARRAKQSPDQARERRRELFLKKVEQGREDKRWVGRTEQILRSDYMAQRRRWEAERDQEAPAFQVYEDASEADDYNYELPTFAAAPLTPRLRAQPDDEQQVDEIAQMEEEELRQLLLLQEQEAAGGRIPSSPSRYGSDDDEYDDIFMELVSSHTMRGGPDFGHLQSQDLDAMDMT